MRRVEALLARADTIEDLLTAAAVRGERISNAILAKAFRGDLVETEAEVAPRRSRASARFVLGSLQEPCIAHERWQRNGPAVARHRTMLTAVPQHWHRGEAA